MRALWSFLSICGLAACGGGGGGGGGGDPFQKGGVDWGDGGPDGAMNAVSTADGSTPGSDAAAAGGGGNGGASDGGTMGTVIRTGTCTSYPSTTIAAMRNPAKAGCYELSHVGLVARTDSPTEPRIYVQDQNGSDYSAILAKCSSTGVHACSAQVAALIPQLYDTLTRGAQISVRGYYQYTAADGFEQFYIEQIIDEGTTLPRPAPIAMKLADITRDARTPAKWFQRTTVTIPAQDPLVMYDFSPADLSLAQNAACPAFAGFAMIPKSAGVSAPLGCSGSTSPAPRAVDPREVLVGRQFFKQFLYSTDCACAAGTGQILLQPGQSVSGTVLGYLMIEKDKGTAAPYQVFQAAADQSFKIQ